MRRMITAALLSTVLLLPLAPVGSVAAQQPTRDCPAGFVGPLPPQERPGPFVCVKHTPAGPFVIPAAPPPPSTSMEPVKLVVP